MKRFFAAIAALFLSSQAHAQGGSSNPTAASIATALGYTPASLSANTFSAPQTITSGIISASVPALDVTQTWNNGAVAFTGLKQNITNTASSSSSLLIDLQIDGASAVKFGLDNAYWKTVTSIGPTAYKSTVDYEVRDVNGDLYTEIRVAGATNPTANFLAAYTVDSLGFIEQWTQAGASSIDVSPKPTDGSSTSLVSLNRNTSTSGNSGLNIYQGNATASLNTHLSGKPAINSYIAALSGNGKVGIGLAAPLTTLHVENDRGATTKEILRLTDSAGGTALGLSLGYSDSGSTDAYVYNRYATSTAALSVGFGTTMGSGVVQRMTADLKAAFAGSIMVGSLVNLTLTAGAIGMAKIAASASAPGAAGGKVELVCGTNAGTAKLVAYAGTSGTAATILDNIGAGVSGC